MKWIKPFTAMRNTQHFAAVSETEARNFVRSYPGKLEWNVTTICEPPLGNYNDFTLGDWPESMVVKVIMEHERKDWQWFIRRN